MMTAVELQQVSKRFGNETAVNAVNLAVTKGEFIALLGPSGCGKTTTLRIIAGLETASSGRISINGRRVDEVPVHKRNIGMVFQNNALFPHRTAYQNVAYGLKTRRVNDKEIHQRVRRALDIVRLPTMDQKFPGELSGGQQQRVAIARAIVIEPDLLLLDEPLSALDAKLREEMRSELKRIQKTLGITTLFVTHDQSEALSLPDRVVLMNKGQIEQEGAPDFLFQRPRSEFAARFFGHVNEVHGSVTGFENGLLSVRVGGAGNVLVSADRHHVGPIKLLLREERGRVESKARPSENALPAVVKGFDYLGMLVRYTVETGGKSMQLVQVIDGPIHSIGTPVFVNVPKDAWMIL